MAMNFHFFPCPICHMELFWELREITVCVCMYVCVCVCVCVCVYMYIWFVVVQSVSRVQLFVTPCTTKQPGFPVLHYLPEFVHTHVRWVGDAIQPSYPLSLPSPLALNLSQRQGISQWAGSSRQVVKLLMELGISSFSGLISSRIDWLTLLTVQGTLKSLLQHSLKASILRHSAFLMVQLSHIYGT